MLPRPNPDRPHWTKPNGAIDTDQHIGFHAEHLDRATTNAVAGCVLEPIQGWGGSVMPSDDSFPKLRQLCDDRGILLMADEALTSWGRTGKWLALEHGGVELVKDKRATTPLDEAGKREISPTQPVPLAGHPHGARLSTGIHDPLLASKLYLAQGVDTVALVALEPRYLEFCADQTVAAATAAQAAAQPRGDRRGRRRADWRQVTENPAVDIVHVCTPNDRHKEALLSARQHQKPIDCDKPLGPTLAEAAEIRAALKDYRGTSQMGLQNRFFPATLRAKQLIAEGFLGQVLQFGAADLHAGSADPTAPLKWKLAAGVIADLGSHVFDLVQHLLGDYAALHATTHLAYPQRGGAEDCVLALTRMQSGAVGVIEATKLATGSEDELRFEIHGSTGALRFNGMDPHHLEVWDRARRGWTRVDTGQRYPAPTSGFPTPRAAIGWLRGHAACLANFLQAIAAGQPGDPGLAQGIKIQHIMDCARRSAREQRWVDVA